MAGNYPNVPSWRMAWDRDGTQAYSITGGVITQLASGVMASGNSEAVTTSALSSGGSFFLLIFPELRDIDGLFLWSMYWNGSAIITVSTNTTNGIDGTWTSLLTYTIAQSSGAQPRPNYRTIQATTTLSIKAIRLQLIDGASVLNLSNFHVFGEISPAQNPNRLALWHPTLDQRIVPSYFDWGDVPRSSSADKTFRVKNLSASLTANSIRVAQDVLTDTVPSVVGQHTLSTDGLTFLAQVNVGTLAPAAISAVTTLRRITPSNAVLSVWAHRVFAEANTWS